MRAEKLRQQRPGPDHNVLERVMASSNMPYIGEIVQLPPVNEFSQSGVYFLHLEGRVVYVGQAKNVWQRLGQHMADGQKRFDSVSFIPCSLARLDKTERRFIQKFLPDENRCPLSKRLRREATYEEGAMERRFHSAATTTEAAAAYLGITVDELAALNREGRGPPKRRLPRSRTGRYILADLRRWKAEAQSPESVNAGNRSHRSP